jgi:lipid A disaccharide synthetase
MAEDFDLLLSIFPFEMAWYAKRVPKLRVEFVGHPMVDRYATVGTRSTASQTQNAKKTVGDVVERVPTILILPGSRRGELQRHLPVMLDALKVIQEKFPGSRAKIVLPDESLVQQVKSLGVTADVQIQAGGLPEALAESDVAIGFHRYGHHGVRLLRRANGRHLQNVVDNLRNREAHRHREIPRDAEPAGE